MELPKRGMEMIVGWDRDAAPSAAPTVANARKFLQCGQLTDGELEELCHEVRLMNRADAFDELELLIEWAREG